MRGCETCVNAFPIGQIDYASTLMEAVRGDEVDMAVSLV